MDETCSTDLRKIFELRIFLAGFCARLAARRITDTQIGKMEALLRGLGDGYGGDNGALLDIDKAFRGLVCEAADNAFLADRLESLYEPGLRGQPLVPNRLEGSAHTVERLRRLLEALRERNEDEAETLMKEHTLRSQGEIVANP